MLATDDVARSDTYPDHPSARTRRSRPHGSGARIAATLGVIVGVSTILAACAPSSSAPASLTIEEYFAELPTTYCGYVFSCCDDGERANLAVEVPESRAACEALWETSLGPFGASLLRAERSGRIQWRAQAAAECLAAARGGCGWDPDLEQSYGSGCSIEELIIPLRSYGDACLDTFECGRGTVCQDGTCESSGDYEGRFCERAFECGPHMYCDTGVRECTRRRPDGAPCGADRECQTYLCEGGVCGHPVGFCDGHVEL